VIQSLQGDSLKSLRSTKKEERIQGKTSALLQVGALFKSGEMEPKRTKGKLRE
jgi:hypothetical protein